MANEENQLLMEMGDAGNFVLIDDKCLGFSVYKLDKKGMIIKPKVFFVNSKGQKMLMEWLVEKMYINLSELYMEKTERELNKEE